jgi:hypothetical protein
VQRVLKRGRIIGRGMGDVEGRVFRNFETFRKGKVYEEDTKDINVASRWAGMEERQEDWLREGLEQTFRE